MIHICGCTEALRFFLFQVLCTLDHRHCSTYIFDMHIFVKCLWGAEAGRIAQTQVYILGRVETQVSTRAEYNMINQVMLIQTTAKQESPMIVLPFILQESATDIYFLIYRAVISPHIVFQFILVEFDSGSQVRRHKNTFSEAVDIL